MPRAEVGSLKHLSNKLKSRGLQRLRWYCQVCERQMRDENGFKQHCLSEGHVRQMMVVGENSHKYISDYTRSFTHDFLQLLRTSHSTKMVNANHFYQEYIANKEHIHMGATSFHSLSEFVKHLGREGICRVEEGERGMNIAWIDNSPEALRRQDALRKKERQDKGDEQREQKMIAEQVERARRDAEEKDGEAGEEEERDEAKELQREEGQKIKLSFGGMGLKKENVAPEKPIPLAKKKDEASEEPTPLDKKENVEPAKPTSLMKKNVFSLGGSKEKTAKVVQQRPMSEAERIMKEELERKRRRESGGFDRERKKVKT